MSINLLYIMFTLLKLVLPNNIKTQIYIQPKNIEQLIFKIISFIVCWLRTIIKIKFKKFQFKINTNITEMPAKKLTQQQKHQYFKIIPMYLSLWITAQQFCREGLLWTITLFDVLIRGWMGHWVLKLTRSFWNIKIQLNRDL